MTKSCSGLFLLLVLARQGGLALSLHSSPFPQHVTQSHGLSVLSSTRTSAATSSTDMITGRSTDNEKANDPANAFNVPLEQAAQLWSVSVSEQDFLDRKQGVPFLDSKSKDFYVDTMDLVLSRKGGMGLELLELAGGRDQDDLGIVIVEGVSGNAQNAGVIPGDSIAAVTITRVEEDETNNENDGKVGLQLSSSESVDVLECECRNFDTTMGVLTSLPPDVEEVTLTIKRLRRWPKVQVVVEYPPIQCANPKDNTEEMELFAGENLRQALLNRGIVMEDTQIGRKCDFCGGKCTIKVDIGMELLSPMSSTEAKLMSRNPKCRVSCKTTINKEMREGTLRLKVNVGEWSDKDKKNANIFASR